MKQFIFSLFAASVLMAGDFTLQSTDIGAQLTEVQEFNGYGCTGQNVSPQLSWSNAPKGTKSFVITMRDTDSPIGIIWWHWLVINIPANVTEIATDASGKAMPKGAIELKNNYGTIGFGGACPPKGDKAHRYVFTVFALDVDALPITERRNDALLGNLIKTHTIAKASITSYYQR